MDIAQRLITDFYITDVKSGVRALVKAGCDSKVFPLIEENILVNISSLNRELSSTMKKWLQGRRLSCEARLLRLEEGYYIVCTGSIGISTAIAFNAFFLLFCILTGVLRREPV